MGGKYTFRTKTDTANPICPRLYDLGITAGRTAFYLPNANGARTGFVSILAQGARAAGDLGCSRAVKVVFAGFELPERAADGTLNWIFHDGRIPDVPDYKLCTATAADDLIHSSAHGYTAGTTVAFIRRGKTASIGAPLAAHTKYFVVNPTADSFQVAAEAAGAAIDLTANSAGVTHCYRSTAGLFDAVQGRPTFFPDFNYCFAGICYLEILLPAELSNGEDEPSKLKVILDGKLVWDYVKDSGGGLAKAVPVPSKNPMLIALDVCLNDGKMPASRFGTNSTLQLRDRCAEKIAWIGGNDAANAPAVLTLTGATVYNAATATLTGAGAAATPAISARNASIETIYHGGDVNLEFSGDAAGTGVKHALVAKADNTLYFSDGGSETLLGDVSVTDRLKISYDYEFFKCYRNGVPLSLENITVADQRGGDFYGIFRLNSSDAMLTDVAVAPSGTNAVPRMVDRFTGGIVVQQATALAEVFETEIGLCGGVSWQDVDGFIEFLTVPDRTPVMTLNANAASPNACNVKKCTVTPRHAGSVPNNYPYSFRDRDDPILTTKYVFTDRPERRAEVGYIPAGIQQFGVLTQSQMERLGETKARLTNDCDVTFRIEAFLDSLPLAKGDFFRLVDDASDFPDDAPALCMVLDELYLPNGDVEARSFEATIIVPDYYSDTRHGRVQPVIHNHIEQQFIPPAPIVSLTIQEIVRQFDGTSQSAVQGEVVFSDALGQQGRVFIRELGDGLEVFASNATDTFTGSGLETLVGLPVAILAVGGGAPAPPLGLDGETQYILRQSGAAFYLEKNGAQATFTTDGTGTLKVFQFKSWRQTGEILTPNASTREAGFTLEALPRGFYQLRVVPESSAGIAGNFFIQPQASITLTGDNTAPAAPENFRGSFDGLSMNWAFDPSPSLNVKGYQVRDGGNRIVRELITGLTFQETLNTSTVTRRIYAVSRSGVLSIDFAVVTFVVPPSITWIRTTGGDVRTDNSFLKTALTGWGNCGALASSACLRASSRIAVSYQVEATGQKMFGFSGKKNVVNFTDLDFALHLNGNTVEVYEFGVQRAATARAIEADDRVTIEILASGTVNYRKGFRGDDDIFYTSTTSAARHLYYVGIALINTGVSFGNRFELDGYLFPTDGFFPHYNNFTRCEVDALAGSLTGGGLAAWNTSGASSVETVSAENDFTLGFGFAQTNRFCVVGVNPQDADQHVSSIPFSIYAHKDGTFAVRNNLNELYTSTYTAATRFHLARVGATIYALKDGVIVFTATAASLGVSGLNLVDASFYEDGVITEIRLARRITGGISFGTTRPQARVGNATVPADSLSGRVVGSTTSDGQYRGGDTAPPIPTGIGLDVPYSKPYVDGTGDIEFQLNITVPASNYLNFNSAARVRVRIFNRFGAFVKEFAPMSFAPAGGVLPKLTYARKYADPTEEAMIGVSFENAYGFGREIFYQRRTVTRDKPAADVELQSPHEAQIEPLRDLLHLTWQNPAAGNVAKTVYWRKLGAKSWTNFTLPDAAATSFDVDAARGIVANQWYEAKVLNGGSGQSSNIALGFTVARVSASYPAVATFSGRNQADGTTLLQWTIDTATGVTEYQVFRNGVFYASAGTALNYTDTTVAAGSTNVYTVYVKYGTNVSPASAAQTVMRPTLPAATDPSDLRIIASAARRFDVAWNMNGNAGAATLSWSGAGSGSTFLAAGASASPIMDLLPSSFYTISLAVAGSPTIQTSGYTQPEPVVVGGGGGYCFLGNFEVLFASGARRHFEWISRNQIEAGSLPIKSFDANGILRDDFITGVLTSVVFEYLEVKFKADVSPLCVTERHRFFNEMKIFAAIGDAAAGEKFFSLDGELAWDYSEIESITRVEVPEGVQVFNVQTERYSHYFVGLGDQISPKAVHNRKDDQNFEQSLS